MKVCVIITILSITQGMRAEESQKLAWRHFSTFPFFHVFAQSFFGTQTNFNATHFFSLTREFMVANFHHIFIVINSKWIRQKCKCDHQMCFVCLCFNHKFTYNAKKKKFRRRKINLSPKLWHKICESDGCESLIQFAIRLSDIQHG